MSTPSQVPVEHGHHQRRYYRFATPLAALALAVSIASAIFTWRHDVLIGEANDLTRQNNVVSQRAFVYFFPGEPNISGESSAPKAVNFFGHLSNSGNTPTKNLTFFYKCAPSAEDLQEP
jgi:hypothetical protein